MEDWLDGDLFQAGPPPPPPDPAAKRIAESFQETYRVYSEVVDLLVEIYRTFDKTRRATLKEKLEDVYEALKALGARVGISAFTLPHLSDC